MSNAKDSGRQITLEERLTSMENDIEELKKRVNLKDKSVGMPDMKNYNTDTGPWTPKVPRS